MSQTHKPNCSSKEIRLTKGMKTIVDEKDYDFLNQWKWYFALPRRNKTGYAQRIEWIKDSKGKNTGKCKGIRLHRLLMNPPMGMQVDHINGNSLDNRRSNLRICTVAENIVNRSHPKNNKSGYKGVHQDYTGKWEASIGYDHKRFYLGLFVDKKDAARAYNKRAKKLFGKYAKLNKV